MKKHLATLAAAATALVLTACSSGNPLASSAPASSAPASSGAAISVVVGSANFPESELLAEIYAGALKAKGVTVSTKLNIASRETYVPALENGEIDMIPEYTGGFSKYLNADADTSTEEAALASLKSLLPDTPSASSRCSARPPRMPPEVGRPWTTPPARGTGLATSASSR